MRNFIIGLFLGLLVSSCLAGGIQDDPILGPAWRNGFSQGVNSVLLLLAAGERDFSEPKEVEKRAFDFFQMVSR